MYIVEIMLFHFIPYLFGFTLVGFFCSVCFIFMKYIQNVLVSWFKEIRSFY